eukprot:361545-Chlamydomonas_euryale.AAC.2
MPVTAVAAMGGWVRGSGSSLRAALPGSSYRQALLKKGLDLFKLSSLELRTFGGDWITFSKAANVGWSVLEQQAASPLLHPGHARGTDVAAVAVAATPVAPRLRALLGRAALATPQSGVLLSKAACSAPAGRCRCLSTLADLCQALMTLGGLFWHRLLCPVGAAADPEHVVDAALGQLHSVHNPVHTPVHAPVDVVRPQELHEGWPRPHILHSCVNAGNGLHARAVWKARRAKAWGRTAGV